MKWTVPDVSGWDNGLKVEPLKPSVLRELGTNGRREALHRYRESTLTSGLNFKDVQRERAQLGEHQRFPICSHFISLLQCIISVPFNVYVFVFSAHHKSLYVYCLLAWFNKCCLDWSNLSVCSCSSCYNELRITLIEAGLK